MLTAFAYIRQVGAATLTEIQQLSPEDRARLKEMAVEEIAFIEQENAKKNVN